jgi:hypothetical protein
MATLINQLGTRANTLIILTLVAMAVNFGLGGAVRRASSKSSSKPPKDRGRGLPHQYPWIDCVNDIQSSEPSKDDEDA